MGRLSTMGFALLLYIPLAGASAQIASEAIFSNLASDTPQGIETYTGKGHWLVVMIWASTCYICNVEATSYAELHTQNAARDVRVLGISMDGARGRDAALEFVTRHNLPFENLIAEPGALGLYYEMTTGESLRGTPTFMVFDPSGTLTAAQAGAVRPAAVLSFIEGKRAQAKTR